MHALVGGRVRDALGKLGFVGAEADPLPGVFALAPPSHGKGEEERLRALEGAVRAAIACASPTARSARRRRRRASSTRTGSTCTAARGTSSATTRGATRCARFARGALPKLTRTGRGAGADFAPPKNFKIAEHVERMLERGWKGMTEEIVVRFAPGEAWRLSRLAGARVRVKRQADGAVDAHFRHTNPDALVSWVMAMGGGVVIESPQSARDEVLRRLERAERAHAATR